MGYQTGEIISQLMKRARKEAEVYRQFMEVRESTNLYGDFCAVARKLGYELYPMDLVDYEEEFIGQLQKSVNGGGAQHELLEGQDSALRQFYVSIERKKSHD